MESISCAPFLSMEIWFWRLMVGWFGIFIYEISINFYDWQRVGRRKNKYSRVKKIHSSFIFRINFQPQYLFSNSFLFNYQIHFFSPARFDQFFKDQEFTFFSFLHISKHRLHRIFIFRTHIHRSVLMIHGTGLRANFSHPKKNFSEST